MPELPELTAHAERLTESHAGRVLGGFRALSFTALKTATPDPSVAVGHPLERVDRRGKHLILRFGDHNFVIHLMQGGRLRPDTSRTPRPRGGLARWVFHGADPLLLTEAGKDHRAGVWVLDAAGEAALFSTLGPDAADLSLADFARRMASASGRVHTVLRDQKVIAGIGRRLANEICHAAGISPFAAAGRLDDDQIQRLHGAVLDRLEDSLAFERAQTEMVGSARRPARVHHRSGAPCPVCGDAIRSVAYATYEVDYCPACQTGGRILADNTTSRFLR